MSIELFIQRCFEVGIILLNKENLTKEEESILEILNEFEEGV